LKSNYFKLILVILFLLSVFSQTFAQGDAADDLNSLLTDGEDSVEVDTLVQEVAFDNVKDWETHEEAGQSATIDDGVYRMVLNGDPEAQILDGDDAADSVIQVNVTQLSEAEDNAYGVICRAQAGSPADGYYFQISGDGFSRIILVEDGDETALVNWEASRAIGAVGDENELMAVCAGTYLALYVNEVLVAETHDDTFTDGQMGFTTAIFGGLDDVEVTFDDLRIWSAANSSVQAAIVKEPEVVDSLTSYDGEPKDAITELEQLGVIPSGSSLIFNEDYAYFAGQGSWFTPLASRAPHQNIVAGAELTFTVGNTNDFESCTLTTRIKQDNTGTATTYIDIGIANDGFAYVLDAFSEAQDANFEVGTTELDLDITHHILFTLIDDSANIYVDGELEIADFKIAERSGTYGIGLIGAGPNARCEGRNIWAYAVPNIQPGECAVSSTSAANKRRGPGTTFDVAGQLTPGEDNLVIGQGQDTEGKKWWQIEDETWVREDLVTAIGDCANIPISSPS